MKKSILLALLFCALLPMSAMAVTEGIVENAPMVEIRAVAAQEVSYLPDASYYAMDTSTPSWENSEEWVKNERCEEDGSTDYMDTTQSPRLTAGEAKRARKLAEDYRTGKTAYTGESVLEKSDEVIVGVYALEHGEFDGEQAFVLLPGTCLTDEQLLSIIAAYDEMGLTFDPDGLNYRNCARGGGIETNRFFTDEERERYSYMADCIRRGQLKPPDSLPNETVRSPKLKSEYFNGLDSFSIKPYRAMTDEEILCMLVAMGVHDESGEIDHNDVESRARTAFYTKLGCPLSMELDYIFSEGSYSPMLFTADASIGHEYENMQSAFGACFSYYTQDNIKVYASAFFSKSTGELVSISAMHDSITPRYAESFDSNQYVISDAVTQEKIDSVVAEVESKLNLPHMEWHTAWDNEVSTNWGLCVPVRAQVEDNCVMTIYIGGDDGCEHGLELNYGTLVESLPSLQ